MVLIFKSNIKTKQSIIEDLFSNFIKYKQVFVKVYKRLVEKLKLSFYE